MRKWSIGIGVGVGLIIAAIVVFTIVAESDFASVKSYTKNENLPTVKSDFSGTPIDQKGRFVNLEFPFLPSTVDLLKWKLSSNPQKEEKQNDNFKLTVKDPFSFLNGDEDGILWLGHASVMIRLDGKVILLDPVFGNPSFIERYFDLPSPIENIKRVDYVLISHDHLDHLDKPTITAIAQRFPDSKVFAGLGMEDLLDEWVGDANRVQTAGWYQQFSGLEKGIKITFVPVRHWSRRGLSDTNARLWGGFVIQGGGKAIYHGGDSGYGSHYAEMETLFPDIDYFVIGIGSYEPRWFMKANHNNPEDALTAFVDSKAKHIVPMHYATFNMSDEPPGEPLRRLMKNADDAGLTEKIIPLQVYENIRF